MRYAVWSMCGYSKNFPFCHPLSHAVPKDHQNCGWETNTFPSALTPCNAPCIWTQFWISCLFGKRTHPLYCLRMYIHTISVWQETMWENKRYHLSVWLPVSIKGFPFGNGDLTHPHMETVNHRFQTGNEKILLPISIWKSRYGNRDWRIPVSIWGVSSY